MDEQIHRYNMPYGRVLIVDDAETNVYIAEGLMLSYDLQIDTANSGFKAIEKISRKNTYDIIFMDHMMPVMDGVETTLKLRSLGYDGIIVALTANVQAGNAEMFKENGFDDFISKPIDLKRLDTVLNKYIRDRYPEEAGKYQSLKKEALRFEPNTKLFRIFCRDAEKAVKTLQKTFESGDIKLFTTTVHAMKSALTNIGEQNTSEAAFALETAGINGDTEFIAANTEMFIASIEALLERIINDINSEKTASDDNIMQEDNAFLQEQLQIIKSACENYDDTAAYAALDRLKEKPLRTETYASLEEIRDKLYLQSDFDGAAGRASALITAL